MKATILIGVSGSGKSTFAKSLGIKVVSADDYFMIDGRYEFDVNKLAEAHAYCLKQYVELCQSGKDVIVDNTNTSLVEIAPYVALGQAYGEVECIFIDADWKLAAKRNSHGVGYQTIERMGERILEMRRSWPSFWPKLQTLHQGR